MSIGLRTHAYGPLTISSSGGFSGTGVPRVFRKRATHQPHSDALNGEKERELKQITSEAYRLAQEIAGRADAEAADIYAAAYNADSEFSRFLKTMEIFQETLGEQTVLVLSTDNDLLRYLGRAR